ncbi:MAG: winged helix-turn-helix domain-containing protein [Planctomycetia bacterium]|nr:winged helix-turn-helix domain-containing protein [Planctomycetia bacterium]
MPALQWLRPGTRFRLAEMPEVTGILLKANECRALVRLDRPEQDVEFADQEGQPRRFQCRGTHVTSWAPTTVVEPVGFEPHFQDEENDMSKSATKSKSKATKSESKAGKPAKAAKAHGKLSCLDAAAKVLAEAKEPMTTKALIEAMAAKKLWTSPGGKTPAATLYSAILRELGKGKESRFKKTDKGLFAAK